MADDFCTMCSHNDTACKELFCKFMFCPTIYILLELVIWADKCFVHPPRDLNSHNWYTAATIA